MSVHVLPPVGRRRSMSRRRSRAPREGRESSPRWLAASSQGARRPRLGLRRAGSGGSACRRDRMRPSIRSPAPSPPPDPTVWGRPASKNGCSVLWLVRVRAALPRPHARGRAPGAAPQSPRKKPYLVRFSNRKSGIGSHSLPRIMRWRA